MMYGGNGLTSWFGCFQRNKLTMFGAHYPVNLLSQLAESKVLYNHENSLHGDFTFILEVLEWRRIKGISYNWLIDFIF